MSDIQFSGQRKMKAVLVLVLIGAFAVHGSEGNECPKNKRPTATYNGYPNCSPGPNPKQKQRELLLYAIPACQSEELWQVDKNWGGAHVTLGKWAKDEGAFKDLKDWMDNSKHFDTQGSWHPTLRQGYTPNRKTCSGAKKDGFTWYPIRLESRTLEEIRKHAETTGYVKKGKSPSPDLHISAVVSGRHSTKDLSGVKKVVTDPSQQWDLALVRVEKNGAAVTPRQKTKIHPWKKKKN